ncbi:hypothetical protein [Muriicola marianensis]|nr:hypothetical protein [Muriicola marianensis]
MNSADPNDREARAYLSSVRKHILFVDLSVSPLTQRQWAGVIEKLDLHPSKITDPNHKLLKNERGERVFLSMDDWLNVLAISPEIVMGTIVVEGDEVLYFRSPKDLIQYVVAKPVSKNNSRE